MKLLTTKNTYTASNCELTITQDMTHVEAFSYGWWKFISTDSVGNIIFNNTTYSPSTNKHQWKVGDILNRLGIKVDLYLYHTRKSLDSIQDAVNAEIKSLEETIIRLNAEIQKKGSWRKTNKERQARIVSTQFQIKDLINYRDNYINKKLIPRKNRSVSKDEGCWAVDRLASYERYFKKSNGKLKRNEYQNFLNKLGHYQDAPDNIDQLKSLFNLKETDDLSALMLYRFTQDTNNMIPSVDSSEYGQLRRWLKRMNINKETLNPLALDKLHEYLTNKVNRKNYSPAEARPFPVSPKLEELAPKVEGLRLIKTDHDLRREGRTQKHCIGSKTYIERMINGYQAFNYKGFTFYLNEQLQLLQTNGYRNASTPTSVIREVEKLLRNGE